MSSPWAFPYFWRSSLIQGLPVVPEKSGERMYMVVPTRRSDMSIVMPACGTVMCMLSAVLREPKSTAPVPRAVTPPDAPVRPVIRIVYAARAVPASAVAAADSATRPRLGFGLAGDDEFTAACPQPAE